MPVLLDSSFLLIPLEDGVDIFSELERLMGLPRCLVPRPVIEELRRLREMASPSEARKIGLALKLAERCELLDVELAEGEDVDDLLVRLAQELRCPVATKDGELRRRLRKIGVPVIYLRQRAYLEVDGELP
ncbi:hypothetical protein J7L65_05210 [Candidatus Bathyarchaeota archaeon]|nr:hypothetical protein [Candidatus Bathyarchaeota archaeon]